MRKPDSRTILALLFALAAGVATAALQPGTTPQTNGLLAARAVAARVAVKVQDHASLTGIADPSAPRAVERWGFTLAGTVLDRR